MSIIDKLQLVISKSPKALAVIDNSTKYSYSDIWTMSGRVAEHLLSKGIKKGSVVGLDFYKSAEYIAAIFGVWRVGAAFVPIAKGQPDTRLKKTSKVTKIDIIISQIPDKVSEISDNDCLDVTLFDTDLAYVFFTSGSTGEPKAVGIEHSGLVPLINAQIPAFELCPSKRVLFYLDISFDASISDILTCLCSGATLVIESNLDDITSLHSVLNEKQITTFDIPPSLLSLLDIDRIPVHLETLIIGGEPSNPKLLCKWAEKLRVVNVYGPTESTICSSLQLVDPKNWTRPLLGKAINGTEFSVRNKDSHELTAKGELWISGRGLARGYLGSPSLTDKKFITENGVRWYKTGDMVFNDGDDFVFLGRIDRQLKVRGRLVSPEEIEACLLSSTSINQAAVVLEQSYLIAYLVGSPSDVSELIKDNLPLWMQPSRVYWVNELPRLNNGKINFSALPKVNKLKAKLNYRRFEELLLNLFSETLELSNVGLDDDFFDLGGDSIALMSLIVAIESHGYSLSAEDIYANPTVRTLAIAEPIAKGRRCDELKQDTYWKPQESLKSQKSNDTEIKEILITGATGFLGAEVIVELLAQTEANIHCLIRANSNEEAYTRLKDLFKCRDLIFDEGRLFTYAGDIQDTLLGLGQEQYSALSSLVDTVIHCAAQVNMLFDYSLLYEPNVLGTKNVLNFSGNKLQKTFWYTSTLSVFVAAQPLSKICLEDDTLKNTELVYGGYAQSKWVSERMVRNAKAFIPQTHIARFGLLTGKLDTGKLPDNDLLTLFIRAIKTVKCIPQKLAPLMMDSTPVDYAAKVMVAAFINKADTVHIVNPWPVSGQMLIEAFQEYDASIQTVSLDTWLNRLSNLKLDHEASAAILGLSRLFKKDNCSINPIDLFAATGTKFDQRRLSEKVNPSLMNCSKPSLDSLIKCITSTKKLKNKL